MYKLFFIAKNNIKKHKGDVAILFALMFLAAFMLFSSLSLMLSGKNLIEECDRKYHVSDLIVFAFGTDPDGLKEIISSVENTGEYEAVPCVSSASDYYYADMKPAEATSNTFYYFDSSLPTRFNAFPEEFIDLKDDEIVIPYYQSYMIKTGDIMHLRVAGKNYDLKVAGYVEHLYFATALNISGSYALVSHNVFNEISEGVDPLNVFSVGHINVKEGADVNEYDLAMQKAFPDDINEISILRDTVEMSTPAIADMASTIVMQFTILLIIMSVIIMHFSIRNFIELNIQNIGLLQASGYTARELRMACITEQMIICIIAAVAAIFAGVLISRPLSMLSGMMVGLSGFSGICVPALVATLIIVPQMVLLGSFIATRSYKKLTVLESLRSGITSHNFKRNHFPLETSRLPLELVMAGKNIFGSKKKNIFITLIVAILTMSSCIGFSLFQNWALDNTALLKTVGVEFSDVMAGTVGDEDFLETVSKDSKVKNVNTWTTMQSVEVTYMNNSTSLSIDVYRDVNALKMNSLLEGHLPENGNEIVLTTIESANLNAAVGDIVNVKSMTGSGTVPFTVSGIDQKVNNMGKKALMNEDGARRINPGFLYSNVLIYLEDPSLAKDLKTQLEKEYPEYQCILGEEMFASTIETFSTAMVGICVMFIIMTCFVVILTQLLLTRAQVIRERTDLGVSKALGYTSGELIRRTLMTNIPAIAAGIVIGIIMHLTVTGNLFLFAFSIVGIKQNSFSTDPVWLFVTAAMILTCAILTAFLCGRSITKLEPARILKEE